MGKRKYEGCKEDTIEKSLKDSVLDSNDSNDTEQPRIQQKRDKLQKRAKIGGFDIKHFRKELAGKQGQTMVLTQFLQVCLNPDNEVDYILEYLKSGGNSHEILRQINQESKKNITLATPAFHLFHLIILKVQSSLPHMIAITEEACRYFLNNFMSTVEIMISENSGPRHRKIILKLLTSMVPLNPDLGVEVLSHAPLTPKHLHYIVEKANYKEKDNVRTAFVHFMTSFLVDGHLPLIKALLEKQGLLALVIPGLVQDEVEAVLLFLNILKKNVIDNSFISKSLKLKTFSHHVLHNIFKIFAWKGPPELTYEARNEIRSEIMKLLSDIILTLFTSHKLGLYFVDNTFGTSDFNKNQNLYKALLTLKRPWENEDECETILEIVYKCPDLHRAVMNVVEHSFEPQHSPIWERTVGFVIKLLDKMKPENVVPRMNALSAIQAANFVRFVTLPVPLLKFIQTNLGKDQTMSLYCIKVLVRMLKTLKRYMQILEMEESSSRVIDLKNKLDYFLPKHLPLPTVIVSLIQDIVSCKKTTEEKTQDYRLPKIQTSDALLLVTDLLLLYNDIQPTFFEILEGNINMKQILDFSVSLDGENISLLKFKIVSLWLTLDRSVISVNNPMFKELFIIMLEVYTCDENDTWVEAKSTLHNFLKNTGIFEADEDEIHLLLYSLRNAKVNPISLVADIIEYVLQKMKELTMYMRNQTVHFEITNEGDEACLEKLFNDLMETKSTEDCVFLEYKVPSTFIVGCVQFTQSNREAKRNLKHFLSLYIANLFHCNYSPELTEVLIGDSKLDVRKYVTNWVTQPVSLPDNVVTKDKTLLNISKSIIDKEEFSLPQVFTCLEQSTDGETDVTANEVPYKVNVSSHIDSSELFVWAKYLVFCTVQLAKIESLDEEQHKRITTYFQSLIDIGKKIHLMNECREIITSLFKNPHILKLYRPLTSKENTSTLLATEFLLDIITVNNDIINYLNNKHKILRSYKHKNYTELVKAFIKINKNKIFNSDHAVKSLEIVGMTYEDDLHIFNKIFSLDINCCLIDDKDPSLIFNVLQTLIQKYSKSAAIDTPEHVIRKSMKLYTELLTKKDINPNLTNVERALMEYFENKPHHAAYVNDEIFKKFFNASSVRKSTSQLASVLMKHNLRLCNVFREQTNRPEILNQRELTLPLGNAAISHRQFFVENKELLNLIFQEYKSNITKLLEKPHKAGQVYIACWEFARKLVIECMEVQDCQKLFAKSNKFEVVYLSHVNLLQAVFMKMCLNDENHKKEYLINYLLSMLHLTTIALKENNETELLVQLATNIIDVIHICQSIDAFTTDQKEDFQKITESAVWQHFCKAVLKDSLKVKTTSQTNMAGPQLLYLLTKLVKLFYLSNHGDIVTLFDMVTSHSEFLNVMLSHHSNDIKSRLMELLYSLIQLNKSVMKSQQIPVYLSSYHATRSPCDRLILAILHFYENNGQPVNEYKPYVFGDSAANHYAVRKNRTSSLWGHPTPNRVLNLFDRDVIEKTVNHFPVAQKLEYHYELGPIVNRSSFKQSLNDMSKESIFKVKAVRDNETAIKSLLTKSKYDNLLELDGDLIGLSQLEEDCSIYDPVFLFPLLSHLLAPGSMASCFKLLRTGLLSVPVMALSSLCPMMRAAAYHVLHRFCLLLETETRHKNDKLFLTDFINTLRQSLTTAIDKASDNADLGNLKNPRLPAISALYLARALMVSTASSDPLYKPVNNFFIAKKAVDLTVVPDFLTLFHDSDVEAAERRLWILDVLKEGVKTLSDVNVVFKTMCLKMIMDFYSSVLSDRKVTEKILGALNSVIAVPRAFEILLEGYGLMSWLNAVVKQLGNDDKVLVKRLLSVIENMVHSVIVNAYSKHLALHKNGNRFGDFKINKDVENEILNVLYDLLPYTNCLDIKDIVNYVKIYNLMSKRATKCLTRKKFLTLVSKIGFYIDDKEIVKLLTNAVIANDGHILKSKFLDVALQAKNQLLEELFSLIEIYIV